MKIYFIYSEKHDNILDRGISRKYSGYMSYNKAKAMLDLHFDNPHHPTGIYTQLVGRGKILHKKEDWKIIEVEIK